MGSEPIISLNTLEGEPYDMCDAEILDEVAEDWAKRLVRRNTWSRIPDLRLELVNRSRNHLARLCPKLKGAFGSLASAGLIEIRFHQPKTKIGWSIPWEFLLSSATENERQSTLLVVRQLVCGEPVVDPPTEPETLLVHKNNPGYLGRYYRDNSLKREEKSVEVHLGLKALPPLHNESLDSTKRKIVKALPDVIHVAGVDGKQAAEFAPQGAGFDFSGGDSLIVAGPDGTPMAATGAVLAPALCAADSKPSFVGLNFVNSGGDLAPSMVLNGAYGALGFLNDFDDIAAEVFYFQFYLPTGFRNGTSWMLCGWHGINLRLSTMSGCGARESSFGQGAPCWTSSARKGAPLMHLAPQALRKSCFASSPTNSKNPSQGPNGEVSWLSPRRWNRSIIPCCITTGTCSSIFIFANRSAWELSRI